MDKIELDALGELALFQRRFDCSVHALHANARMKAKAPIEPTSAWPMWTSS